MGDIDTGSTGAEVPGSVRVTSRSGRVEVIAEERRGVLVDKGGESVDVDADGSVTTVSSRDSTVRLRVPIGTDVVVGTTSGRVRITGQVGRAAVTTVSAAVSIETADSVEVRTTAGRVQVGSCTGECRIDTTSGRSTIGRAGAARLTTTSGRITADAVAGRVWATTISGRVTAMVTESPVDVSVETVAGRITVTLPAGAAPAQRLTTRSGSVASEVPEGDAGTVRARSLHGSVRIREAS